MAWDVPLTGRVQKSSAQRGADAGQSALVSQKAVQYPVRIPVATH